MFTFFIWDQLKESHLEKIDGFLSRCVVKIEDWNHDSLNLLLHFFFGVVMCSRRSGSRDG